jgi:hypothetical protein
MKRDLVYTTGELPTRPFDATRFLTPSPHQNRCQRPRVEKVGVGQRLENLPVTVKHIYVFCNGRYPRFMVKMTTKAGDVLVWNTTTWSQVAPRRKGMLSATVESHRLYDGEPQTNVVHCRLRRPSL